MPAGVAPKTKSPEAAVSQPYLSHDEDMWLATSTSASPAGPTTYQLETATTPNSPELAGDNMEANQEECKSPTHIMKEWFPFCEEELKPRQGVEFSNLEECEKFYKSYAHHVGFSVRKSSFKKGKEGVKKYRYFVCSKQGFKRTQANMKTNRKVKLTREGCNAMIGFRRTGHGTYEIFKFHEGHTHVLSAPRKHHMLNSNRGVTSVHQTLFKSLTRANIGPSKAHRIIKEQMGGFQNVGCSKQDLKNFQRDLKAFIKDSDAQMFIENFKRKKEVHQSFYFAYEVESDGTLKHVFWADGLARLNYALYGDVVSFDTTYDTNRYKMVFAPFTGLDNHRLCVTFGAAFLANEKAESFMWLFEKFLDAMGGHLPVCLITDQDPAMKVAIEAKFHSTTHRYCLWHIMRKLSEKVGCSLNSNTEFISWFKSCVYNSETPIEFEQAWQSVIQDFRLDTNDWLSKLFDIRDMWIPAYFRDLFLGEVLRTTSRSESENRFFSNFTNPHLSLVEFWMRFESAVELQRYGQLQLDHETSSSKPELKTNKDLERHVSDIYTYANFYKFQDEFWVAFMDCEVDDKEIIEDRHVTSVVDNSHNRSVKRQVVYNPSTHMAHCSCKMFECEGIPCRHILCVLKGKNLRELPSYYILNRRTKMAASKPIFDVNGVLLEGCSQLVHEDKLISNNWLEFMDCMQVAGRDPEKLTLVGKRIQNVLNELKELDRGTSESKMSELESFIGSSAPERIDILPPNHCHTKGSGKRLKGGKEKAMELQQKKKRLCKACGEQGYHDSRNCPSKLSS